jgi:photosystem II stability/assembly factor-like uncharacterized protein
MRLFASIILLMIVCSVSKGQTWERVFPGGEIDVINDLEWWHGDTVFVADSGWKLLRSTDAGLTWSKLLKGDRQLDIVSLTANSEYLFFLAGVPDLNTNLIPEDSLYLVFSYNLRSGDLEEHFYPRKYPSRQPMPVSILATVNYLYLLEYTGNENETLRLDFVSGEWHSKALDIDFAEVVALSDSIIIGASETDFKTSTWSFATTSDAGETWQLGPPQIYSANGLAVVPIVDGLRCLLGSARSVSFSDDTGRTWQSTADIPWQSPSPGLVHKVIAHSALHWYVLGSKSDVYTTTDAGATWVTLKMPETNTLFHQFGLAGFVSDGASKLIIAYTDGFSVRSTDAGLTWDYQNLGNISDIREIHFFSENDGLLYGSDLQSNPSLFATTNGGADWEKTGNFHYSRIQHNLLYSKNEIYAYTISIDSLSSILLYLSTDLGRNWELQYESVVGAGIYQLHVFDDFWVFSTSRQTSPGGFYISVDMGKTWEFTQVSNMPYSPRVLDCFRKDNAALVFFSSLTEPASSLLWKSTDSCKTWVEFYDGGAGGIEEIDAVSDDTIIVRRGHLVQITTNGGQNWLQVPYPGDFRPSWDCAYFLPAIYTFEGQRVRYSEDFWATSTVQLSIKSRFGFMSHFFLNSKHGWVACQAKVFRTSTGGINWTERPVTIRESAAIESIFPNPVLAGSVVTIEINTGTFGSVPVQVVVQDVLGRQVSEVYSVQSRPSRQTLTWQPNVALLAGMYFVRMISKEGISVKQVLVVR